MVNPTATLTNCKGIAVGNRVAGDIYGDTKGRFVDGTAVWTSTVVRLFQENGKDYIETRNSVYLLG